MGWLAWACCCIGSTQEGPTRDRQVYATAWVATLIRVSQIPNRPEWVATEEFPSVLVPAPRLDGEAVGGTARPTSSGIATCVDRARESGCEPGAGNA